MPAKFFSPESYWNTPLPASPTIHPDNARLIEMSRWSAVGPGLHINLHAWTIPIFEADAATPRVPVGRHLPDEAVGKRFLANSKPLLHSAHPIGHHRSFGPEIPIPAVARPDGQIDAHLAIIDPATRTAWDMWAAHQRPDGTWAACTGISYSLDGPGVFDPAEFAIRNGESIHLYGPGRATGVPIIAGLILHEEILAGRIEHKLAFAAQASALLAHYHPPTTWTDGGVPGGIPGGALLQLDPALDLAPFNLSPAALVVAKALQEYGAVLTDYAGNITLYGEGLWSDVAGRSWNNTLNEDALFGIPFEHYRYLAPEATGQTLVEKGMVPLPHDSITRAYRHFTGIPILA